MLVILQNTLPTLSHSGNLYQHIICCHNSTSSKMFLSAAVLQLLSEETLGVGMGSSWNIFRVYKWVSKIMEYGGIWFSVIEEIGSISNWSGELTYV